MAGIQNWTNGTIRAVCRVDTYIVSIQIHWWGPPMQSHALSRRLIDNRCQCIPHPLRSHRSNIQLRMQFEQRRIHELRRQEVCRLRQHL